MEVHKLDLDLGWKAIEDHLTAARLAHEQLVEGRKTSAVELRSHLSIVCKEIKRMRKTTQLFVRNMPKRGEGAGVILESDAGELCRKQESDIITRKELGKWF